jgi:hypothetical protein
MTTIMKPADVRERFITPLLMHIEEQDLAGEEIFVKRKAIDELISTSQAHTEFYWPWFSDEEVAELIADQRIEWKSIFLTSDNSSDSIALLSHLIHHMEMTSYFIWLPHTVKALNNRYTPLEQVNILKQCDAMPGRNSSTMDGQMLLAGRIVPIILQDELHLDTWVQEWVRGIKRCERPGSKYSKPFSSQFKVTKAYKNLETSEGSLCRIPMLMVLAGVLDQEMVGASIKRFTDATLYDLSYGGFSRAFTLTGDDFSRRNFRYGLYVLDDISRQQLIGSYLGRQVIADNHLELASCILASAVSWDYNPAPIPELLAIRDGSEMTPLRMMLNEHAFEWDEDWFDKLAANPSCADLLREVSTVDSIILWCRDYSAECSDSNSLATTRKLKRWVNLLNEDAKQEFLEFLLERFEYGITHTNSRGRCGMAYAKMLLGSFPESDQAKRKVSELIFHVIKHAVTDKDPEIMAEIVKLNALSISEIGANIKSIQQFNTITSKGGLEKSLVLPHLPLKVIGHAFANDLGL